MQVRRRRITELLQKEARLGFGLRLSKLGQFSLAHRLVAGQFGWATTTKGLTHKVPISTLLPQPWI
jgi:hypothetical protein